MKNLKFIFIFLTFVICSASHTLKAEETIYLYPKEILTQHWAMPTLLNPSKTGEIDFFRIRGGARLDNIGTHNSPKSFLFTIDSPFKISDNSVGVGIVLERRSYDLWRNFSIEAQGSYKLKIKASTFSIGVQAGYFHTKHKNIDSQFEPVPDNSENKDETAVTNKSAEGGTFDLGIGLNYNHPCFHLGVSALHLTNPTLTLTKKESDVVGERFLEGKLPTTLYLDLGGNIHLKNTLFRLQPSVIIGTDFRGLNAVTELRATYNEIFTFGLDYRYNRAVGILTGVKVKNFWVGYSWEYDYSSSMKGSAGNHELVLGYQFKLDLGKKKIYTHRSIRFM